MAEGADWLEGVLKKKAFEESPLKVLEVVTSEAGIPRGENYMSKIDRVKAKILLGSGKTKELSLIIKNEHDTPHMKQFSVDSGVFFKEIAMYRDVLPKMEALLEEIQDAGEPLWPKCYDIRLYDRLVFEDLGARGYKLLDRKKQLGLDGALLVVKSLAKFHAVSKILLDRGEVPTAIFKTNIWKDNRQFASQTIEANRKMLTQAMKRWGEEWTEAIDRIKNADLVDKYLEALDLKTGEFSVLCHGDTWLSNMLFRGDDPERPESVKFVDMQLALIMSPAKDLSYFFLTAVRQTVREQHIDELIQTYVDELKTILTKCGFEGATPDAGEIKTAMDVRGILRFCDALILVPVMLGDHKNMPDMEQLIEEAVEAESKGDLPVWNVYDTLSPTTERIMKTEIRRALDSGLI